MMRTIKLYGVLRKHFGREYVIDVRNERDGIRALCAMVPGFEKFLRNGEERGLTFAVFSGARNLANDDLDLKTERADEIRIVPIIQGSKQAGLFQTILGAVLIVVGVMYDWTGTTSTVGMSLIAGGAALGLGGVVQLLSPTARTGSLDRNEDGNNPSYGFGGAVTTIAQGNPYPVLYGEREIGGAVESGGIYTQDQL